MRKLGLLFALLLTLAVAGCDDPSTQDKPAAGGLPTTTGGAPAASSETEDGTTESMPEAGSNGGTPAPDQTMP